jgi:phosphate transport system protein
MEKEIEALCLNVILRQQPVASDFHRVSAVLKMITDMERIGDIAEDITIHSVMLKESRNSIIADEAVKMGKVAVSMLKSSINAYVSGDVELALNSCREDDIIDNLFATVMKQLVEMIKTDAKGADEAPDLLMIAKYFERMGDHTVNIAEWVVYAFTGKRNIDLDSESGINEALSCIQ